MKETKRIAFVFSVAEAGGAERSLLQTIAVLPRDRYDCHAILPARGSLEKRLGTLGVPVTFFPVCRFSRTVNPFRLLRVWRHVRSTARSLGLWCRDRGIDLVHANGDQALLVAGPAARLAGIRCVRHARDLVRPGLLGRWLGGQADHTMAVSQAVADTVVQCGTRNPVTVVYNGFDFAAWQREALQRSFRSEAHIPHDAFVVGMVAQPVFWKRHDLFLKVAQCIGRKRPDVHFVLAAGDRFGEGGSVLQTIREQILQSDLADRIHLLEWRDDIASVMAAFDVLLHPAEGEPFGRVLVEALALGKPVVAVQSGGPPEIVCHGREGFLVPPGDVLAMAERVLELVGNPELRRRMGEAGRLHVERRFGLAAHRAAVEEVYDRLLSDPRGVAMVVGTFPCLTETFIRRAMVALVEGGTDLHCFALQEGAALLSERERRALAGRVILPAGWRPLVVLRGLYRLFRARQTERWKGLVKEILSGTPGEGSKIRALVHLATAADRVVEMRRRRIVHVHAHFLSVPADVGRMMAALEGVPLSVSAHGWDLFCSSREAVLRRINSAKWVAVCSRAGEDHLRQLVPEYPVARFRLIPHGLLPEEFPGDWDHSRPAMLSAVGRLVEKKGFGYLIEACQLLKKRGISFECVIAGDGPLRTKLSRQIEESEVSDRVRLLGICSDSQKVMELFLQSRAVVIPSVVARNGDQDGIPNVALEAMAAGTPVVAFATGGLPEVVYDGRTGFLVPAGQSEALADALKILLTDEEKARAMGRAARAEAERCFDVRKEAAMLREGFFGKGREP